jgi:16S rRNA (uracil1498-N3)-methyltransferase
LELSGEEARHILLARRIKPGEIIHLQSPSGQRFSALISKTGRNKVEVRILQNAEAPKELSVKIVLFISVVQEKVLDFILQKSTELGCFKIVLFNSAHTATKLNRVIFDKKFDRWQKILWESAKQCGRAKVPELVFLKDIDEVVKEARKLDTVFVCDMGGQRLDVRGQMLSMGLVVGPEGGLTQEELGKLKALPNAKTITLGPFTMRAETAALAALAVLSNSLSGFWP